MLCLIMEKVLHWLTRSVRSLYGGEHAAMARATFERVDSARLDAGDFFASDSMGLRSAVRVDFAETLPAYAYSIPAAQGRRSATMVNRRFA